MGNALSDNGDMAVSAATGASTPRVLPSLEVCARWPLGFVQGRLRRFIRTHSTYGYSIGEGDMIVMFGVKWEAAKRELELEEQRQSSQEKTKQQSVKPSRTLQEVFDCFDRDQTAKIDMLELCTVLSMLAVGTFQDKVRACCAIFDFDDARALSEAELSKLVHFALGGMTKACGGAPQRSSAYTKMAGNMFAELHPFVIKRGKLLPIATLIEYACRTPTIVDLFCGYGTTNAGKVRQAMVIRLVAEAARTGRPVPPALLRLTPEDIAGIEEELYEGADGDENDEDDNNTSSQDGKKNQRRKSKRSSQTQPMSQPRRSSVILDPVNLQSVPSQRRRPSTSKRASRRRFGSSPQSTHALMSRHTRKTNRQQQKQQPAAQRSDEEADGDGESMEEQEEEQQQQQQTKKKKQKKGKKSKLAKSQQMRSQFFHQQVQQQMQQNALSSMFQYVNERTTRREVKALKTLFDDIDIDCEGHIPLSFILQERKSSDNYLLKDVTSMFRQLSPKELVRCNDGGKNITFSQIIDVLYRNATRAQLAEIQSWVPPPVTRQDVRGIQRVFDTLDMSFSGRVRFGDILEQLKNNPRFAPFVVDVLAFIVPTQFDRNVNMKDLLQALFARTHPRQLHMIVSWAKPSKVLTLEQQEELRQLFVFYDHDGGGTIDRDELKATLEERGMDETDIDHMFEEYDITDELTLQDFKILYRDLWDSYINFDIDLFSLQFERSNKDEAKDDKAAVTAAAAAAAAAGSTNATAMTSAAASGSVDANDDARFMPSKLEMTDKPMRSETMRRALMLREHMLASRQRSRRRRFADDEDD